MISRKFSVVGEGSQRVLIAGGEPEQVTLWKGALSAAGFHVETARADHEAVAALNRGAPDAIILDLERFERSPFVVSDYAGFRAPATPIFIITRGSFGADGVLFDLVPTARTVLGPSVAVADLVALIEHHVGQTRQDVSPSSGPDRTRAGLRPPAHGGRPNRGSD